MSRSTVGAAILSECLPLFGPLHLHWARVDAVFAGFLQGVSLARFCLSQSLTREETSEMMCDVIAVTLPIQHLNMGPAE